MPREPLQLSGLQHFAYCPRQWALIHIEQQWQENERTVAKKCVAHGTRVQNSVFECVLDNSQYKLLKHELEQLIDTSCDSLRFYTLGNNYQSKVAHIGAKESFEIEGDLIL